MHFSQKQIAKSDQHIELNVSDDPNKPVFYRSLPVYAKLREILSTTTRTVAYLDELPAELHKTDQQVLNNVDELGYMVNILLKDHEKKKRWA